MTSPVCWIVYTHDTRFSTTQIHEVYTSEEAAQERAAYINADDVSRGVPSNVRFSHATRFLLLETALKD